jgi:hypothetical protein
MRLKEICIVFYFCLFHLNLQVESFENWLDSWSRYEPNLFKSGFVIHNTIQIFLIWICDLRIDTNSWIRE